MKYLFVIFTVAILVQSFVIAAAPADDQKIHPELSRQLALSLSNDSQDTIFVIVIMKEQYQPPDVKDRGYKDNKDKKQHRLETVKALKEQSQRSLRGINLALNEMGPDKVKNVQPLWIVNAIGLEAAPDVIEELAQRDDVAEIIPNSKVHALEAPVGAGGVNALAATTAWGVEKINAPLVWALGYNGTGVNVSIIDTGVNYSHPDLADSYLFGKDYINDDDDPMDDNGHGTHVAGTIAGNGASGTNTGVAPGAKLLVAKVLDSNGEGYLSDVYYASQWSVENGADVISMSLGATSHWGLMTLTVDTIVASGVVPVIAAGNYGIGSSIINCPGDEKNATTVGATDSSDNVATYSISGPVTWVNGTYTKPDMVAPGSNIISTKMYSTLYTTMSGTSMATPHVSGAAALILQAYPELGPLAVKQLLEDTAIDLNAAGKDNISGSGRIDVYEAIATSPQVSNISIYPDPTNINATINATISDIRDNISYAFFYIDGDQANFTVFNACDLAFDSGTEDVTGIIDITNLTDGAHIIHIRVNDSLNYWNNNTNATFTVDTEPPIIMLNSPVNNSSIQNGTIIQFNITDLSLANVTYSINSTQANYTNSTNVTIQTPYEINTSGWNESAYHITIWANDSLGYENISKYFFVIDDTPPNITSVSHNASGIILDINDIIGVIMTGDTNQNNPVFEIEGIIYNRSMYETQPGNYSGNYTISGSEVKNANLICYLTDDAGNVNNFIALTPVDIDTIKPRINLTSPANISYIHSGTIINFTISDTFLANVSYSLNSTQANYTNQTNITLPPPYEINTTDWNESSFDLTVWANDSLNHVNTSVHHIIVDDTPPNLTLTSPTSSYTTTDSSVTITGTTDMDADITINGVLISSSGGPFSKAYSLTAGYNNFTINATDKAGNVNSTTRTIVRYILSTSSSSGGGGGGGSSGEDFNNIAETQTQRNSIFKNDNVSYAFEQTLNPIIYINFASKISAGTIASKIEVLRNTSSMVGVPAPGVTYKNINIWVGNYGWASDRSIVDATIIFVVPREWMTIHSMKEDSITLYRYHNDSWELLPTSILNANGQYVYYESMTPGFSPFAISGEPGPTPTVIQTPVPMPAENTSIVLDDEMSVEPEPEQDGWNAPFLAFLTVVVLTLIATVYDNRDRIHKVILKVIYNIKQRRRR